MSSRYTRPPHRHWTTVFYRVLAAVVVAMSMAACSATQDTSADSTSGASRWTQPRTAWGEPDLQGVWRYEGTVPLERPKEFEGREFLTDEEITQRETVEEDQATKRLAGLDGVDVGRRSLSEPPIRGNEYTLLAGPWAAKGLQADIADRGTTGRTSTLTRPTR